MSQKGVFILDAQASMDLLKAVVKTVDKAREMRLMHNFALNEILDQVDLLARQIRLQVAMPSPSVVTQYFSEHPTSAQHDLDYAHLNSLEVATQSLRNGLSTAKYAFDFLNRHYVEEEKENGEKRSVYWRSPRDKTKTTYQPVNAPHEKLIAKRLQQIDEILKHHRILDHAELIELKIARNKPVAFGDIQLIFGKILSRLRDSGMTFRAIGELAGLTSNRVTQIVAKHQRLMRRVDQSK